jgi:tRNA (guanine37-N1)-methyltransferase
MFNSYLKESILGRAIKDKKIKIKFYNPVDYCKPKERVDGRPYGGGPGMILRPEFFLKAYEKVLKGIPHPRPLSIKKNGERWMRGRRGEVKTIIFSPSGKKFDTTYAKKLVKKKYTDVVLISGRYEGIDARVFKVIKNLKFEIENLSIGDYVLTGGELPAMVLIDSIARQIPGVLGKYESLEEERVSSSEVYTRPEILKYPFGKTQGKKVKNYKVPKVLLSGNHKNIDEWKEKK